jgi:rhodanese-related sulfurtransferase
MTPTGAPRPPRAAGVDDLAAALDQGAVLVDVREPWEYAEAHIAGSTLIPLDEVMRRRDELPDDAEVWLVCRTGNRSGQAAALLATFGHDAINVTGGIVAWMRSGRPVLAGAAR